MRDRVHCRLNTWKLKMNSPSLVLPSKHGRRLGRVGGQPPQILRWGTAHAYVPQYFGISLVFIYSFYIFISLSSSESLHISASSQGYQEFLLEKLNFSLNKVIQKFGSKIFRK